MDIKKTAAIATLWACLSNCAWPNQPDSPFGFHPASLFPRDGRSAEYDDALNIGVGWTRERGYAFWSSVQPDLNDDHYQFGFYDGQWRTIPTNICILANIAPEGHDQTGRCLTNSWIPVDIGKYKSFVRAVVERYDGDGVQDMPGLVNPIRHWQVGNEPDERVRTGHATLQSITYDAVKDADPDATVLFSGPAGGPYRYVENFKQSILPALRELGGQKLDICDLHWFGTATGHYRMRDAVSGEDVIDELRAVLEAEGFDRNVPLWITESGTFSGSPHGGVEPQTERQQAGDLFKRYIYALGRGVEKVFYAFGLMEGFQDVTDNEFFDNTGIIYDGEGPGDPGQGVKKLAYWTYKKMTESLGRCDWSSVTNLYDGSNSDHVHVYRVTREGKPVYIAWWDYFYDSSYVTGAVTSATISNLGGMELQTLAAEEVIPDFESGNLVTDFSSAFRKKSYTIPGTGRVAIELRDSPVIIFDDMDRDGDGVSDEDEEDVGTDPDDPDDFPIIQGRFVTTVNRKPVLWWPGDAGASWYQVWLSRDGVEYYNEWKWADHHHWTPGFYFHCGLFRWWIRSWNETTGSGEWSEVSRFSIPCGDLRFEWSGVPGVNWYHIWIGREGMEYYSVWLNQAETDWMPGFDVDCGDYTWWVQSWGDSVGGYGTWDGPFSLWVDCGMSPGEGVLTNSARPNLTWNSVPGATWYRLWINRDDQNLFSPWLQQAEGSWIPSEDLRSGLYTWWFQPWGPLDGYGPWSSDAVFFVP